MYCFFVTIDPVYHTLLTPSESPANKNVALSKKGGFTSYENIKWASDSASLHADYKTRDSEPYGNIIDQGKTEIKLSLI